MADALLGPVDINLLYLLRLSVCVEHLDCREVCTLDRRTDWWIQYTDWWIHTSDTWPLKRSLHLADRKASRR